MVRLRLKLTDTQRQHRINSGVHSANRDALHFIVCCMIILLESNKSNFKLYNMIQADYKYLFIQNNFNTDVDGPNHQLADILFKYVGYDIGDAAHKLVIQNA